MALSDYTPVLAWFADSKSDLDEPTGTTVTDPVGALGSPTLAGTPDSYADFDGSDGISFLPATPVGEVNTGDFTYVFKARVDTFTASDVLWDNYDGSGVSGDSHGVRFYIDSGAGRTVGIWPVPRATSFATYCSSGTLTAGQDFIIAFRRSSSTVTVWLDADASGGMTSNTPDQNNFGTSPILECGDITIGCDRSGANAFDGRIYWVLAFDAAISDTDIQLSTWDTESSLKSTWGFGGSSEPYSATGSTGIQNFQGFQASQIGIHRNVTPGKAEFNAVGFAPSTSAGRQIDAAVGYANAVGFGAQAIYDSVGIAGRINFNTGTHQTHVTREFFGLLGQLRALGFLVDQTNSQGFFPNLGTIYLQGPTGATVTVISPPSTFTAAVLLRETNFVGFQAQTIRDFFPISASTHALGFTPQYVEFIKEITGPTTGEVNFSGFQAQAIILGQINDAIGQKGEVNLVGFQHAVDMWRTLDILQGQVNMQGFAPGIAIFQGGTVNLAGVTGEVNFDTLAQAVSMYRTFYPDSGLTNAEGFNPTAAPGLSVQSIVGILNQEGFVPFIVSERYRGIVGEATFSGFAPTIGGGLWTPKRRRATSWAAIN